jgi:hypothetical protein
MRWTKRQGIFRPPRLVRLSRSSLANDPMRLSTFAWSPARQFLYSCLKSVSTFGPSAALRKAEDGPSRHFAAAPNLVATGAKRTWTDRRRIHLYATGRDLGLIVTIRNYFNMYTRDCRRRRGMVGPSKEIPTPPGLISTPPRCLVTRRDRTGRRSRARPSRACRFAAD